MANDPSPDDPEAVRRAVSRLSPMEREVLILGAGADLWNDEIAARLGVSQDAVERHLADALCELDRDLERQARPWWKFW